MSEKKVTDLSFELRREFALGNIGKYIPNLVHLIPTITKYKPQKRKNGKFCFGCFALEMDNFLKIFVTYHFEVQLVHTALWL